MKHVRHLLVAALTVFLAAVLAVPAFAADTHSITLTEGDTHTYYVYQVLTGTMAKEGDKNLGNPAWGADATAEAKATDVQAFIDGLKGKSEEEVAAAVAAVVNTSGNGRGTVSAGNPITDLPTGYYVLVDKTTLTGDFKNDTKALNVVQVVNDIDALAIKWDTTSDDKIITTDTLGKDNADKNNNEVNGKTDNVSIGDTVNYQITAKIPAKSENYNYFYFIINDTLSKGLTLNPDSIVVYKDAVAAGNELEADVDYTLKTGTDATPYTFQVGLIDAKALSNGVEKTIIVTYSAVLNENAEIGEEANPNTSTVKFSNDPNNTYTGSQTGFPAQTSQDPLGETPITETKTYTTGIEIKKVDEKGNVLTGAEFTITGDNVQVVLVSSEEFKEAENGEYYGLNNGTYTTEAPITADKMEPAEAGATEGYVEDADYTGEDKVEIGGKVYRPYVPATDSGKTVYILVKANADQYDGKRYNKTVTYTQKGIGKTETTVAVEVGADGVARFIGLGEGTYTISETKTPAGYNTIADQTLKIVFDKDATPKWKKDATSTADATYSEGVFKITIQNQKGTTLPETGGMGTTILYIVGGGMVIAGIVMFLTKRRMASVEK